MRLSTQQIADIRVVLDSVLEDQPYTVGFFGSRLNDAVRGGDVDLVLTTPQPLSVRTKAKLLLALEETLLLPFDVVFYSANIEATPFQRLALESASSLPTGSRP